MKTYKNINRMLKGINPCQITKVVDAREYLDIVKNKRDSIVKSEIVSPKLGRPGLGGFKVTYKIGYTLSGKK